MKTFIFILLFLFSFSSFASMHDLYNTKITEVYINNGGVMLIKIEGLSGYITLGVVGDKVAETFYSSALAAKLSQQNTWVRYWDAETGYPTIGIISIK